MLFLIKLVIQLKIIKSVILISSNLINYLFYFSWISYYKFLY